MKNNNELLNTFYTLLNSPEIKKIAEDEKVIREKFTNPPDGKLNTVLDKAHPKPEYIAEAKGDGGLVENLDEQHDKMQDVVLKMPTGNYSTAYAAAILELVKIANECENINDDLANLVLSNAQDLDKKVPLE